MWSAESSSRHNGTWNPAITDIIAHHSTNGTSLTTFTFCNHFPSSPHRWKFYNNYSPEDGGNNEILPVRPKTHWCFLQGSFSYPGRETEFPIRARLLINQSPPPPYDAGGSIFEMDGGPLYWNCLAL
jgi:hypothetical protein